MEAEKRKHERKELVLKTSLVFENREVSGDLSNLSAGGALLRVQEDDNDKIASTDMGQAVLFRMEQSGSSVSKRGQICRYVEDSGEKYVAIMFVGTPRAW
jgi:hypothetical protein